MSLINSQVFQEITFRCLTRIQFCMIEVYFKILHDHLTAALIVENHLLFLHFA